MEDQGKPAAWQIREFPEGLRRQIVEQARAENVSVGDFLARCVVLLRDAGWPREIAVDGFANPVNQRVDLSRLREAAEIVATLAPHNELLPKGIASQLWATLSQEVRTLRASQPKPTRKIDGLQTVSPPPELPAISQDSGHELPRLAPPVARLTGLQTPIDAPSDG